MLLLLISGSSRSHQKTFCGLGASMVIEVLHLARIHPLEQACNLFDQGGQRQRHQLVEAIK